MTREEAIEELKILKEDYWDDDGYGHETKQYNDTMLALDMAIEALEQEPCNELPTLAIPQNNNGCENCRWQSKSESEMPCKQCMHNYTDKWEMEKPTETITMTREEFIEKLMEHYRQGRADEKAYQNGEIMQSFNPN